MSGSNTDTDTSKTTSRRHPALKDSDILRQALYDSIGWQDSLADTSSRNAPEHSEAKAQSGRYRALLKQLTGSVKTPSDLVDEGARVSLEEIRNGR